MDVPALGVPLLLVLGWIVLGVGLLVAFRRSRPRTVLRLAAAFLALWAVLATTALAWVVVEGGWAGLVSLAQRPLAPLDPTFALVWIYGASGAFTVFAAAFLLNQLVGRSWLRRVRPTPLPWPSVLPRPREAISLGQFPGPDADAFSFTLIERGERRSLRRREVILISERLWAALSESEREAVVAHELGHIRDLDARYLTFIRTFARMMRWDPVIEHLAVALTRREEFGADVEAVALTRRPRALARALFKAGTLSAAGAPAGARALLGSSRPRDRDQLGERIRRLIRLAESGRYPPEPDGG